MHFTPKKKKYIAFSTNLWLYSNISHYFMFSQQPAVSLSNPKQMQPRDQENEVSQERPDVDTQRLLIAAKEIENLMQKDYRGMSKPRRKPPINNHEPRH